MLKALVLLAVITARSDCYFIQPNGPTHKRLAADCVEEVVAGVFEYKYFEYNTPLLLTFMVTVRTGTPTHEIQEQVLRKLHQLQQWPIEVLSESRYEFQPFHVESRVLSKVYINGTEEVTNYEHSYRHVLQFKTSIYIIIIDTMEAFDQKLEVLTKANSFNPHATYVIYFGNIEPESKSVIVEILMKLMNLLIFDVLLLVPSSLTVFDLYRLDFTTHGPNACVENPRLLEITKCIKGDLVDKTPNYFEYIKNNYHNCSFNVIATEYEPFVITDGSGFEIDLLREVGNILNIYFNITIVSDSMPWGSKDEYGNWSGSLEVVYDSLSLGVGNVPIESEYFEDFAYSTIYFQESMVWIIPRAEFVEKWMVLFVIFTLQMWGICFAVFAGYAITFFVSAKFGKEVHIFRSMTNSCITSFEMLIGCAVPSQPVTDMTRVFFVSLAMFSIIIGSVYTSSLVFFLTHPIRKYQIKTGDEIWNSDMKMGGTAKYRQVFNSTEPGLIEAFNAYVTSEEDEDTETYWIGQVANHRNVCTISSGIFVKYLISIHDNVTTDKHGRKKVYVSPQQVFTNFIAMIMRKGHPLRSNLNRIIRILVTGGFVEHYTQQYFTKIKKSQDEKRGGDAKGSLSIHHLQGAFSMLLLGYAIAAFSFIVELIRKLMHYYCKRKLVRVKKRRVIFPVCRPHYRNVTFTNAPTAYRN